VGVAGDVEVPKVDSDVGGAIHMKIAGRNQAPQRVQYLDVNQVRGVEIRVRI
jgi:hypothetical protein